MKTIKLALAAFLASGAVMYAQETKTPTFEVGLEKRDLHDHCILRSAATVVLLRASVGMRDG